MFNVHQLGKPVGVASSKLSTPFTSKSAVVNGAAKTDVHNNYLNSPSSNEVYIHQQNNNSSKLAKNTQKNKLEEKVGKKKSSNNSANSYNLNAFDKPAWKTGCFLREDIILIWTMSGVGFLYKINTNLEVINNNEQKDQLVTLLCVINNNCEYNNLEGGLGC